MKLLIALMCAALVSACANNPPVPDWHGNAKAATERSIAAWLVGNARVDAAFFAWASPST